MPRIIIYIVAILLLVPVSASGQEVPFVKAGVRELPSLNTPRSVPSLVLLENGEILAVGGHTTGFIPAETAEYFDGKEWHEISMNYTHDGAFTAILQDGSVLVGGGSAEPFGIGQSWGVERYIPAEHRMEPVGILDRPRAYSSALVMPGDTVVVAGNWYSSDAIEVYVRGGGFRAEKPVTEDRCQPYILQSAPGNAIIFGSVDTHGNRTEGVTVDRLKGEPFFPQILEDWEPYGSMGGAVSGVSTIGDYTYLVPAISKTDSIPGILKIRGEDFFLLETGAPIPVAMPDGSPIKWSPSLVVNRSARKAYQYGYAQPGTDLILEIDYNPSLDGGKSSLKVFYAEGSNPDKKEASIVLTPAGNILIAGGREKDNFHTLGETRLLILGESSAEAAGGFNWWWLLLVAILIGVFIGLTLRRKPAQTEEVPAEEEAPSPDLMSRITTLLEKEEWFRRKDLTKATLAQELGTNTTYITATVNSQGGTTFSDLVAGYRIAYAQKLMRENPQMLLTNVAEESGFSSEKSFFRTFKAKTGLTPTQWKQIGQE